MFIHPHLWVYLLHALIIGPILIYLSYMMLYGKQQPARWWWDALLLIGISATAYHAFKAYRVL